MDLTVNYNSFAGTCLKQVYESKIFIWLGNMFYWLYGLKSNQNILFRNNVTKFRDLEHRVEHKSKRILPEKQQP